MELLENLSLGFSVAFSAQNLAYCLAGAVLGTLVGVLPGVGPVSTIALLLPITFGLPPVSALIMLAGIYYGAQYGGSTSSILVNLPGEASSIVTCLDGHAMARNGRAGIALSTAAIGSFFAGCVGTAVVAMFAPALTRVAMMFGPAEYVALMACGLAAAIAFAGASPLKAAAMVALGLLLGLVGTDVALGVERFTFGIPQLSDGIDFVVVAMGVFGFAEIMTHLAGSDGREILAFGRHTALPAGEELRAGGKAVLRGTSVGAMLGVLPGSGAVLASFAAYTIEKKIALDPSRFGRGAIEGVAAPEAANNAAAQTSFIPLLTLGIPSNAVMALMLGAMTIHGIVPGPDLATRRPDLFWGMIASMWIGNLILLLLNLPLIAIWVKLLTVPYRLLYPAILLVGCLGVYSVGNSAFDVMMAAAFGVVGYVFVRLHCDRTSFLLGFILGPLFEENLRRAMIFSGGDATVFLRRPISLVLLMLGTALLLATATSAMARVRQEALSA
jgi:putative tricarboxylic transport membrane protein